MHIDAGFAVPARVKAPNGLAKTSNQRFKPWFKPMVLNGFSNFLNRFKNGSGLQTNRSGLWNMNTQRTFLNSKSEIAFASGIS